MRLLIFVLVLSSYATVEARPGDTSTSEMLVGWSDDGRYHAVITQIVDHGAGGDPREEALEVREGLKVVKTFGRHDPALWHWQKRRFVPSSVSVEGWKPLRKYRLKRIKASTRTAFKDALTFRSEKDPRWPKQCANQWQLLRKADSVIVEQGRVEIGDCVASVGGYLHAKAPTALVKLVVSTCISDTAHGEYDSCTWVRNKHFLAIDKEALALP